MNLGIRMKRPPHPGIFVKVEILQARGISVNDAKNSLGVNRTTLVALLCGRTEIFVDFAIRIKKSFGISIKTLLRLQESFDLA
jgi:addiction module HigA family antidote